ncbi:helix-turn-helix domain-containing protein [Chryseobacterium sp. POL2]|uniref:helix-turn-helix domain-containing protein n=1 Tax=Chryseobacterium sp. POL2 TaxID=2713414 RepID=UPI0013E1D046|nr:helix-turn-helix domain-containing protein [Chryseobacterium sp. POL2]QIG90658.1 helix-turn-helix domain-containing protein [Chryseobacterium sp. POL2]
MAKEKSNSTLPTFVGKDILSFQEAIQYLDLSESSLYKLTSDSKITFFKPNGGKLYFKKTDLDNWMLQNENISVEVLEKVLINKNLDR